MPSMTIIVPCAGQGRRFAAPYPKELHCVAPGETLLDRALAPVVDIASHPAQVRLVAVIRADRGDTVRRLAAYADRLQVLMIFQTDIARGLRGALEDAVPHCVGSVLLLLPDQLYTWSPANNPLRKVGELLAEVPVAVVAARCQDPALIRREGALLLDDGPAGPMVRRAREKPEDPESYNAVWAVVGCRSGAAHRLIEIFDADQASPLQGAPAVLVTGYHNISSPGDLP